MPKKNIDSEYIVTPTVSNKNLEANYYVEATFTPPSNNYTNENTKGWYPKIEPGSFWI